MKTLVIVAAGDNVALHRQALAAAVGAVESVNGAPVYRAYIQGEANEVSGTVEAVRLLIQAGRHPRMTVQEDHRDGDEAVMGYEIIHVPTGEVVGYVALESGVLSVDRDELGSMP